MGNWSEKRDPIPDKKDAHKFKSFLENKYVNKRFSVEAAVDSDDSSESEKKKKKKKDKKKKKAKKVESSSDSDNDDNQEEEIVVPTKKEEVKKGSRKLGAPPGFKAPP